MVTSTRALRGSSVARHERAFLPFRPPAKWCSLRTTGSSRFGNHTPDGVGLGEICNEASSRLRACLDGRLRYH